MLYSDSSNSILNYEIGLEISYFCQIKFRFEINLISFLIFPSTEFHKKHFFCVFVTVVLIRDYKDQNTLNLM